MNEEIKTVRMPITRMTSAEFEAIPIAARQEDVTPERGLCSVEINDGVFILFNHRAYPDGAVIKLLDMKEVAIAEFDENNKGFRVGEICYIKGHKFKIQSVKPKKLVLKITR